MEPKARLEGVLTGLGFGPSRYAQSVDTLSGGERARLALALALGGGADVLLLDEPTLGLDLRTRRWLADTLAAYPGALILASHDRALLAAVCTHTAHLESAELTVYRGGYGTFRQRQTQTARTQQRLIKERHKAAARLTEGAARLRGWGTPKAQRSRRVLEQRLERLATSEPEAKSDPTYRLASQKTRGTLLRVERLSFEAFAEGETPLAPIVNEISLSIRAGDRIALVGPNGSGKSTLLRLLAGDLESLSPHTRFTWGRDAKLLFSDQQRRGLEDGVPLLSQLERHVSTPQSPQPARAGRSAELRRTLTRYVVGR